MIAILQIIDVITSAIILLVVVQFVIGLLFAFNVVSPTNEILTQIYRSINSLLDPILRPIRRILPDTGAIDFSPLVLIIGLNILTIILRNAIV